MAWVHIVLLTLLPTMVILNVLSEVESAAVKDGKVSKPQESPAQVFRTASDASNFFKRRGRRSYKSANEYNAEQRVQLAATERRREYYEEQAKEYETHREEERDEQHERRRQMMAQWWQYHYDGYYPRYPWHQAYV